MLFKKMPPQIQSAGFLIHTLSVDKRETKLKSAQILQLIKCSFRYKTHVIILETSSENLLFIKVAALMKLKKNAASDTKREFFETYTTICG